MKNYYIGVMSGTSVDGIDVALVDFSGHEPQLVGTCYDAYSDDVRAEIHALCVSGDNEIERLGAMDVKLGKLFADSIKHLLNTHGITKDQIKAIGSHGQTIRHRPHNDMPFTLQIGDPNVIAAETGITTIADFRRKDIALGGQGAPLVPAFHQAMFADKNSNRVIVNIGGIANITLLSKDQASIFGFDTGPGNTLLDAWNYLHNKTTHDHHGDWGRSGHIQNELLEQLLSDPYFEKAPPKSTGREHFNIKWLYERYKDIDALKPVDIQRTLVELTARTIADAIYKQLNDAEIILCGGGTHNQFLVERIREMMQPNPVHTTDKFGIHPDYIEAYAFAWLAKQTLDHKPGNLPSVTGAKRAAILGGIYYGR